MNKVNLIIDTSKQEETLVALTIGAKYYEKRVPLENSHSQVLLVAIDELLKKNRKKIKDISEISIEEGPGSFTGLRVGMAVVNTFGWLLSIKINGVRNAVVTPKY